MKKKHDIKKKYERLDQIYVEKNKKEINSQ